MNGVLEFVTATQANREFCWRVQRDTMRVYVEPLWGWDESDQRRRFDEAFDAHRPHCVLLDAVPVGMLKVDYEAAPVRLLNIQIVPECQRRGLGARVIQHVIDTAGARPVWLQVLRNNPARVLYERLGFDVVDATPTHWQMQRASR